jgi:hypothetical protein
MNRVQTTEGIVQLLSSRKEGSGLTQIPGATWEILPVRAAWSEAALESVRDHGEEPGQGPLIGVHRARINEIGDGRSELRLDGISTAVWKEFETDWTVEFLTASGDSMGSTATNLLVRANQSPSAFTLGFPLPEDEEGAAPACIRLTGLVQRLAGLYHGHGTWMRLSRSN